MTRVDLRVPDERVPLHDRSAGRGRVAGVRDGACDGPVPGQLLQREQPGRPGGRRVVSGVGPVVVGPAGAGAAAVGPPVVRHGPSIGTAGQPRYSARPRFRCSQGQPAFHASAAPRRRAGSCVAGRRQTFDEGRADRAVDKYHSQVICVSLLAVVAALIVIAILRTTEMGDAAYPTTSGG